MSKRIFALILAAVLPLAFVVLAGCAGVTYAREESLVGYWSWNFDPNVYYAFYADGTGYRAGVGTAIDDSWSGRFHWETPRDGRLDMFFTGRSDDLRESFRFVIEIDEEFGVEVLTITNRTDTDQMFSYIRAQQRPDGSASAAPGGTPQSPPTFTIPPNNPVINMPGGDSDGLVVERNEIHGAQ